MSEANIKVQLDLSNYGAKADLNIATGVDTLNFAKKTDLESDKYKLDTDKLKNIPSCLNNLKNRLDKLDIGKLETTK